MDFGNINQACSTDLDEIFSLYKLSIQAFESKGIFQWNEEYPTLDDLKENLIAGSTWIWSENRTITAAVTLDDYQDRQYKNIIWAFDSSNVLVIHRLVTHPMFQGKGLGRKMVLFSEDFAFVNGFDVIRLDAFIGNPYSQNLYNHLGYNEAIGYCYYHNPGIMCNCFEKRVRL